MKHFGSKTETEIKVLPPYDFGLYSKLFIRKPGLFLPFSYSTTKWSRIVRVESGSTTPVDVTFNGNPREPKLHLVFHGAVSSRECREIQVKIAESFCTHLDLRSLYEDSFVDVHAKALFQRLHGLRPHLSIDPFESLVKIILRQVVRAATAQKLIDNIVRRFGQSIRSGEATYYCFPSPESLAKARKQDLLSCNVGFKWRIIKQMAREIDGLDLDLEELATLSSDEVVSILTSFDGIGPWTSRVFLYDGLHRLDCYPRFDVSIRKAIESLYPAHYRNDESKLCATNEWGTFVVYLFGSLWADSS